MSLPALPDIFGNYALGDFNEVVSPPAVDWLPQTPGWYLVGALILFWLARAGWRWLKHWYRNRYRGEAARKLAEVRVSDDIVAEVNRLLKLTALAAFPRPQVAALSGESWTEFLNAQCEQPVFNPEQCQLLALGVYQQQVIAPASGEHLLQSSLAWVNQHRNRYDD
jgi:Domain of unknown function (DUF4381)